MVAAIYRQWPAKLAGRAVARARCESTLGADPKTWDLWRAHAGFFQIGRSTWERFFAVNYGWDWPTLIFDPDIHAAAGLIIYYRQGAGAWPNC